MEQKMQILRSGQYKGELTYIQVYPQRNFEIGFIIQSPTENDKEYFYQNVEASDPKHNSFVLVVPTELAPRLGECEMYAFVRKYIKEMLK